MGEKSAETQEREIPSWFSTLFTEKFFAPCSTHERLKKNSGLKNILCLVCCSSFCLQCLFTQCSCYPRRVLLIRRFLNRDVVRVADLASLIDTSLIQPQKCNNEPVVFINGRKEPPKRRASGNTCLTCRRGVQNDYAYCSLHCKFKLLKPTPNSIALYERVLIPDLNRKANTSSPSGSTASEAAGGTGPSGTTSGSGLSNVTLTRRSSIAGGSDLPGQAEPGSPSGFDPRGASGLGAPNVSDPRGASRSGSKHG